VTTEEAVEVRTDLVALTLTKSVALSASGLEEVGTLLCVTCFHLAIVIILYLEGCKRLRKAESRSKCSPQEKNLRNSFQRCPDTECIF
jgi:hypothetical protein